MSKETAQKGFEAAIKTAETIIADTNLVDAGDALYLASLVKQLNDAGLLKLDLSPLEQDPKRAKIEPWIPLGAKIVE